MKAVIMAGGEGTRLRPLTCNLPKPMARLCGRPILEYILDLLLLHGVTESALSLGYLADVIRAAYADGRYKEMSLSFAEEETPLGTAGGVKYAAGQTDDEILVISGDALCDFDLSAAYAFHKKNAADATILCKRVSDPREYGLVSADAHSVRGFIEKPGWNLASSGLANTGIYIISREVLDLIPDSGSFDFAKDLFPLMLEKGMKIAAKEDGGYWCDIGSLETYLQCSKDLLHGKISFYTPPLASGSNITGPVYIGKDVKLSPNCKIGPDVVIDDGVSVGPFSRIRASVVLENAWIGRGARLTGTVLCDGASLKPSVQCFEGAVVGACAVIGEKCSILPGVKIWPGKSTDCSAKITQNLVYGTAHNSPFDDNGITGTLGIEITPHFTAEIGAACGSLKTVSCVGIGCDGKKSSKALKMALTSGVLGTGSGIWDFGNLPYACMLYAASLCSMPVSVYIAGGKESQIRILGEGATPLSRNTERELVSYIQKSEYERTTKFKEPLNMSSVRLLYEKELLREAPLGLDGITATTKSSMLTRTLSALGCDTSSGPEFKLSKDGCRLSVLGDTPLCDNQIKALCSIIEFEKGNNVAAPYDAPKILDLLAERYGKKVLRYFISSADNRDRAAKSLSKTQLWMNDGMRAAIKILYYLKQKNISLSAFAKELPAFFAVTKPVEINQTPAWVFEHIENLKSGDFEGVEVPSTAGSLFIRPSKRGNVLNLFAEAETAETANELCGDLSEKIQKLLESISGKSNETY